MLLLTFASCVGIYCQKLCLVIFYWQKLCLGIFYCQQLCLVVFSLCAALSAHFFVSCLVVSNFNFYEALNATITYVAIDDLVPSDLQPYLAMGFSAMFNFQLQIILRGKHCLCPIAVMGVVHHLGPSVAARQSLGSLQTVFQVVIKHMLNCHKSLRFVIHCAAYRTERLFSLVYCQFLCLVRFLFACWKMQRILE